MTPRRAVLVTLLLCSLTTCDDDPTPAIPEPTPASSSPTVTDSVSPTEPTETPEALTPEETVRAWVDAHNHSLSTGDVADETALAAPTCTGCASLSDPIAEVYGAGGKYVGGLWRLVSTHIDKESDARIKLSAGFKVAPGVLTSEAGAEPTKYKADRHLMRMELSREGDQWLFSVIAFIS